MRQFWGWSPFDRDKIKQRKPDYAKARRAIDMLDKPKPPEFPPSELIKRSALRKWLRRR